MADITKRVDEKDKKEAQDLKENQDVSIVDIPL